MSDTDLKLLARYARQDSQDAFEEIVRRHLALVHCAALRQVRSPELAQEVAQAVFIALARQAKRIAPGTILPAWLYEVTRRQAIDVVRREASRRLREQVATEMHAMNATTDDWIHVEPLLDEAMHALDDTDRAAVLLRYFENKSLKEVGQSLGTSDDAAQKRVSRAVERLREFFANRNVTVGASGLAIVLSANAAQAAPPALVKIVTTAAMAHAVSTAAPLGAGLMQSLKLMTSTQLKTITVAGLIVLLSAGLAVMLNKSKGANLQAPDITGAWEGVTQIPGVAGVRAGESAKSRVVCRISRTNEVYSGFGELIDASPMRYPITELIYNHPVLRFSSGADITFEGALAGANEFTGTVHMATFSQPWVLRRTPTPGATQPPVTDGDCTRRAGSDLQGRWDGKLGNGPSAVRVVVRIAEPLPADFRAELDNTTSGWLNQRMSVSSFQRQVKLMVSSGAGMFEGRLNNDATEITGRWMQAGNNSPAVFRRIEDAPLSQNNR